MNRRKKVVSGSDCLFETIAFLCASASEPLNVQQFRQTCAANAPEYAEELRLSRDMSVSTYQESILNSCEWFSGVYRGRRQRR